MKKIWVCVYCGNEVSDDPHPNMAECCGEVGHVEEVDAYEDGEQDDDFEGCDEPYDGDDGDATSALASAGWGTDEDYGGVGGEDWF